MRKAEIIAKLPKLTAQDRGDILAHHCPRTRKFPVFITEIFGASCFNTSPIKYFTK